MFTYKGAAKKSRDILRGQAKEGQEVQNKKPKGEA